jgi:hypothetical protein
MFGPSSGRNNTRRVNILKIYFLYVFTFLHYYYLNMTQPWVRNWPQLYKHIHKSVLVVIGDFLAIFL